MNRTIHSFLVNLFPTPNAAARLSSPVLQTIGLFGLLLCLLGLLGGKSVQNLGMGLLVIATFGTKDTLWPILKRDPLFKVIAVAALYLILRTVFAIFEFPELAGKQIREGAGMLRIALILLFGWWIGGTLKAALHTYWIVLVGLFLTLLFRVDWLHLSTFLGGNASEGNVMALNIHHSNVALFFSTAFMGWIIFSNTFWESVTLKWPYPLKLGVWIFILILFLEITLMTQLRIIWVALFLWSMGALFFLALKSFRSQIKRNMIQRVFLFASILLVAVGLVFSQFSLVLARLNQDQEVVKRVLVWDLTNVPVTSFGTRVYLWKIGLDYVKERPFFGWGPGTTPDLIQKSAIPEQAKRLSTANHLHLHNTYLELFVRVGLIGVLLLGSALWLIVRSAWNLSKEGPLYSKIAVFSLSAFFLIGVAGLTDSYARQIGWFFMATIGGVVYSFSLWREGQYSQSVGLPKG
jgi:O-antigen ligase